MIRLFHAPCAGAIAAVLLAASAARAAPPTKEECVDAHARGQDAREAGQLVQADKFFFVCAQAACPDLVQRDCARFADEVERVLPTVTFVARDAALTDLPDTSVYVDGSLVASDLGDGRPHPIDPGKHEVRFVHAGREVVIDVVVAAGEKARALTGTFPPAESAPAPAKAAPADAAPGTGTGSAAPAPRPAPAASRPAGPLALVAVGAAAVVAGGVLAGVGLARMPSVCSLSAHDCAAPPGDPVFGKASSSVTLINVGAIAGGTGLAVLGGGLAWYLAQPLRPSKPDAAAIAPWVGPGLAGLAIRGVLW
jgi:hypothetical protein